VKEIVIRVFLLEECWCHTISKTSICL
jgi:hypothetical protein